MKKGLLTLLAASLVFVGCQNYDDQFDDLNAQISALKSQVDGLSSISGQVASLSGSISGLQAGVAAAQAAASSAASSASAAATQADANASAIAAATAAATAAGASADAATAAATAATDAANAAVAAGATNAEAIAAATAAATAAGASADAATAAAQAATTAATAAGATATTNATDLDTLAASLAALDAAVKAVQDKVNTASTASAVAALQAEIDALEADVDELLATSNVYTKNLSVTTAAELDAAYALGNKVNIVNGTVTFTVNNAMNMTKVQAVLDKIFTTTDTFTYTASTSDVAAVTFGKLASTGNLIVKQAGDYDFPALVTATTITLDDAYQSKVTSIEFPKLTSVTAIQTDSSSYVDQINFSTSVTNVDLSGLTYYTNKALTIAVKKGGAVNISNLDDKTSTGVETDYTLTLDGPAEFSLSNWTSFEGALNLTNVASATVSGFKGLITVNDGVETINFTDVERIAGLATSSNLKNVTIDLDKVSDPDLAAASKLPQAYGAAISGRSGTGIGFTTDSAALVSLTLTGFWQDVTLSGKANLETVDIDATMRDLSLTNNDNLTTFDVTGSEIRDVTLDGNDGLTSVTLDHTTELNFIGVTTDDTSGDIIVKDNLKLTSLTSSANKIRKLQVTGNDALTTVNFTGLAATGASTETPDVDIYDNDLTASAATDTDDGTDQYNAATAAATNTVAKKDLGSYTSDSGLKTLSTFFGAVYTNTNSDAKVHFDTVTLHSVDTGAAGAVASANGGGTKTSGEQNSGNAITWATAGEDTITSVVDITKGSANTAAGAKSAIAEKAAYTIAVNAGDANGADGAIQFTYGGNNLFDTTVNGTGTNLAIQGINKDLDVAALESAVNVQRATALGITIDAKRGGNSTMSATLRDVIEGTTTSVIGERYTTAALVTAANTATNYGFGSDDYITVTLAKSGYGTNSVTATAASATELGAQIYTAWNAKYGASGTASASAIATMTSPDTGTGSSQALAWTMLRTDSQGYGATLTMQVTAGATTATSAANIDYTIGATNNTSDNASVDSTIIFTIASTDTTGATPLSAIATSVNAAASVSVQKLSTRYRTNTTWATADLRDDQAQNRTDVRAAENSVDAADSNAVARSVQWRVHWLG